MKIGLLTYHHSVNYGAILQSYATAKALQSLGHQVEFINIHQEETRGTNPVLFYFKLKALKRFMRTFYPPETREFISLDELRKAKLDYDCLIVGSDQVWNPDISKDNCLAYFLDFGGDNLLRLSYASSFALSKWPDDKKSLLSEINRALHRFKDISVREKTGAYLLKTLFGLDSAIVIDPTMLHENYDEVTGPVNENGKVVAYLLNRTTLQMERSIELSKVYGQSPRLISTIRPYKGFNYVYPPSIESWIKYIGGAGLVITDSFHGLAFSLLYKRNFVVITPENGRNSRLIDLLATYGLSDRYFNETDNIPYNKLLNTSIDYDAVYKVLNEERKISWNFLKRNL